jgi:predicted HicB family RNase H-like nuclease
VKTGNTMEYRGYTAAIQYHDEDALFYGDVVDVRDAITFTGSSIEELKNAFATAVDDYVTFCESQGEEPEKPFSGRVLLRLEPALHRRATVAASAQQVSLNSLIVRAVERELDAERAPGS